MLNNGYFQRLRPAAPEEHKPEADSPAASAPLPQPVRVAAPEGEILSGEPMPETVESDLYIPGYLMGEIGKYMRVEFLIGNTLTDRNGRLTRVGASFIILESQSGDHVVCDLFSIKFITIIESPQMII